jgi:hypothetical protein
MKKLSKMLGASVLLATAVTGCQPPRQSGDTLKSVVTVHRIEGAIVGPGKRIAILQFSGGKGRVLADLLAINLLRRQVDVVDRDSLSRVVAEVRRTESGQYDNDLSEAEIIQQIGKIVGADFVLVGETDSKDPRAGISKPGSLGPRYRFGKSRLTMRLFSAVDGKVVWLGTSETFVTAPDADHVHSLDYLRVTAGRAAAALTDARVSNDVKYARGGEIASVFPRGEGSTAVALNAAPAVEEESEDAEERAAEEATEDDSAPKPAKPNADSKLMGKRQPSPAPKPPAPKPPPAKPAWRAPAPPAPAPARPAGGGCDSDADCKGNRICSVGKCVARP